MVTLNFALDVMLINKLNTSLHTTEAFLYAYKLQKIKKSLMKAC